VLKQNTLLNHGETLSKVSLQGLVEWLAIPVSRGGNMNTIAIPLSIDCRQRRIRKAMFVLFKALISLTHFFLAEFMEPKKTKSIVLFILRSEPVDIPIVAVVFITSQPFLRRCSSSTFTVIQFDKPNFNKPPASIRMPLLTQKKRKKSFCVSLKTCLWNLVNLVELKRCMWSTI